MRPFKPLSFVGGCLAVLLAGCAPGSADRTELAVGPTSPTVEIGRSIAQTRCASCHAVDASTQSPRSAAPPFVVLRDRYLETTLQRKLEAMVDTEHSEMPPLRMHSNEIEALYAYMESLPGR